jgi:hypothetical protein
MSASHGSAYEHDFEPIRGLPGALPAGETILWQGAPHWAALAVHALHVRLVTLYFAGLIVAQGISAALAADARAAPAILIGEALWTGLAGLVAVGLLCLFAWLVARTSVYTITNRRVVLRVGVAISKAVNLPFAIIEGAALRHHGGGGGDIPLRLKPGMRAGYVVLWPHVRPWRWAEPEPMLRAIPDAGAVAAILAEALSAHAGAAGAAFQVTPPAVAPTPAPVPAPTPIGDLVLQGAAR